MARVGGSMLNVVLPFYAHIERKPKAGAEIEKSVDVLEMCCDSNFHNQIQREAS